MNAETTLCAVYDQEAEIYHRAIILATKALGDGDGIDPNVFLSQIAGLIDDVKQLEEGSASARDLWREAGAAPSPALKVRLERVTKLIENARRIIDQVLDAAQEQKASVAPRMDEIVRQEHGRRAYGAARMTS